MRMRLLAFALVTSLTLLNCAGVVSAQSLQVSPVLLEMPAGKRGAVLTVENTSAVAVDIQVRPYDWQQEDGRDQLTDSVTLQVGPSIVTIKPGGRQMIRLLAPDGPRTREGNWRVLVDQLPQIALGGGLSIRLRLSIPVFAYSTKAAAADLQWRRVGSTLEVSNVGLRYARLSDIRVQGVSSANLALPLGEMPYLLPGSRRQWTIDVMPPSDIRVVGHNGNASFSVSVAP